MTNASKLLLLKSGMAIHEAPKKSSRQARTKTRCETRHSLLEVIDGFKPQNGRIILNGMEHQKNVKSPTHTLTLSIFEPFASLEAS